MGLALANIYAEAEKWEVEIRRRLASVSERTKSSWIEIKSQFTFFVAGDKSHSQWKTIESFLHEVRRRMKEDGYVPRRRYALINEEDR
ncbi:hypothetical protein HPP92_000557 [Vanilla planifolia]|uniref:Uncharacterized protein n=1 Tax=Vanilla planifolia TaxID=51239 RepID=A0A835VGQ7_VANPL|nr:hypothetical protein HPP92_000557 [Vanilla planifolia]